MDSVDEAHCPVGSDFCASCEGEEAEVSVFLEIEAPVGVGSAAGVGEADSAVCVVDISTVAVNDR